MIFRCDLPEIVAFAYFVHNALFGSACSAGDLFDHRRIEEFVRLVVVD